MGGLNGLSLTPSEGAALASAAVWAAGELGVFAALDNTVLDVAALAEVLALPVPRLSRLLDVLVAVGSVNRVGDGGLTAGQRCAGAQPIGGALVARVMRRNRCAGDEAGLSVRADLAHLGAHDLIAERSGSPLAELVAAIAPRLPPDARILDAGSGRGGYSAALLTALPAARATLVDRAAVLPAARAHLSRFGARAEFRAGELTSAPLGDGHQLALLNNVLHASAPRAAQTIVGRVAAALAPGGLLVVRQPRLAADRSAPLAGVLYAFALCILSDEAQLLDEDALAVVLGAAGLTAIERVALATSPDSIALVARRAHG